MSEEITYPRDREGKLVVRGLNLPSVAKLEAPHEDQPGSVDWTLNKMFGSRLEGVRMIESLVASQGAQADRRWVTLLLVWKQWNERVEQGEELGRALSLNQVCMEMGIPGGEFLESVFKGIRVMNRENAILKASLKAETIIDYAELAASAQEGFKDREMLLKIAGVLEKEGGINVQMNQNVGVSVKVEKEEMAKPLRRFKEDIADIDKLAREEREGSVIDGELIGHDDDSSTVVDGSGGGVDRGSSGVADIGGQEGEEGVDKEDGRGEDRNE